MGSIPLGQKVGFPSMESIRIGKVDYPEPRG